MKTGIIFLNFKDNVDDDKIQKITEAYYTQFEQWVESLEFNQFKDESVFKDCYKIIKNKFRKK